MRISTSVLGAGAMLAMSTSLILGQSAGPVLAGDIAFGLSSSDPLVTAEVVRDCAENGNWTSLPYLQSMEFDNACGVNSHAGNLLALNFGTGDGGGSLYSLATNGADAGEFLYAFDGTNPDIELTRVGGLSVSPDNSRVALVGYDTGAVIVLDYQAGAGDGTGAAITGGTSFGFVTLSGSTQGTAWLDNDTILVYAVSTAPESSDLFVVNATSGGVQRVAQIPVTGGASFFTDVEYNPAISPYVYLHLSSYDSGTFNTLTAMAPSNWSMVAQADNSMSMNTGREMALGNDGLIYISSYGATISTISANPVDWVNDGTIECYTSFNFASYNGLDVALDPCGEAGLFLSDLVPGLAGERNELTCCGAVPDEVIYFAYGFRGGSTPIPGCGGVGVDIQNATLAGFTRANGSGCATISGRIPSGMSGRTMFLQALERTTCTVSNLVEFTFP